MFIVYIFAENRKKPIQIYSVCTTRRPSQATRACAHIIAICRRFGFVVVVVVVVVELSDWLAFLIITLFARGDHVWANTMGR